MIYVVYDEWTSRNYYFQTEAGKNNWISAAKAKLLSCDGYDEPEVDARFSSWEEDFTEPADVSAVG